MLRHQTLAAYPRSRFNRNRPSRNFMNSLLKTKFPTNGKVISQIKVDQNLVNLELNESSHDTHMVSKNDFNICDAKSAKKCTKLVENKWETGCTEIQNEDLEEANDCGIGLPPKLDCIQDLEEHYHKNEVDDEDDDDDFTQLQTFSNKQFRSCLNNNNKERYSKRFYSIPHTLNSNYADREALVWSYLKLSRSFLGGKSMKSTLKNKISSLGKTYSKFNEDCETWMFDEPLKNYLDAVRSMVTFFGFGGADDDLSSAENGLVLANLAATTQHAYDTLHRCNYSLRDALQAISVNPIVNKVC